MEAQAITIEKPFSESAAVFAALVGRLGDRALEATHHGAIEELLRVEGQELLRVLYEDHMNLRAQAILEEREVVGVDGKIRTHRREMPRKQMSIFGAIEIGGRTGWRAEGATALSPFDAQLNMPPGIHSHGVRRRVAELASKLAFDGVAEELGKTSGASVGKRQLEELTRDIGKDFDAFYKAKAAEPVDPSATLQIGGVDATGVVMLPEALREATRRAREAEVEDAAGERWPKPKSTRDVQRNGMRMAGVSVVYEVAPYERTALDILRDLRPVEVVPNANPRPRPQAKRVSASVIKPMRLVVRETFDEMERRDPNHDKRWVLLVDGAEHPLDVIEAEAKRRRVEITILLDFIHVAQYVWDAAKVLVPDNEAERRKMGGREADARAVGRVEHRGGGDAPQRDQARTADEGTQAHRHVRRLPAQVRPLSALPFGVARRSADHDRRRRRGVPPSGQRQNGHHRSPLGPRHRRGRLALALAQIQRRHR